MANDQGVNHINQDFTSEEVETMKKLLHITQSLIDSMNTEMIAKLAQLMNSMGTIVDSVNDPKMINMIEEVSNSSNELTELIKEISVLKQKGTLDSLFQFADFLTAVKRAMSTEMILKITHLLPEPKVVSKIEKITIAANETAEEVKTNRDKVGIGYLLRALKDPEIQYMLKYATTFLKKTSKIIQ